MTPQSIEQQYGVSGAYTDTVGTSDGSLQGTMVPVTLADGRTAQLFIPAQRGNQEHTVYLRDSEGLHPVRVSERVTRDEMTRSPAIVERRAEPQHKNKRSWVDETVGLVEEAVGRISRKAGDAIARVGKVAKR